MLGNDLLRRPPPPVFSADTPLTMGDIVDFLREISSTIPSKSARMLYFALHNNINFDTHALNVYNNTRTVAVTAYIHRCIVETCFNVWRLYRELFNRTTNMYPLISSNADALFERIANQQTARHTYDHIKTISIQIKYDILLDSDRVMSLSDEANAVIDRITSPKAMDSITRQFTEAYADEDHYVIMLKEKNLIDDLLDITELIGLLCRWETTGPLGKYPGMYDSPITADRMVKSRLSNDTMLMVVSQSIPLPNWLRREQHHIGYNASSNDFITLYKFMMEKLEMAEAHMEDEKI